MLYAIVNKLTNFWFGTLECASSMNETDEPIYISHPAVINRSALTDFTRFCETATGIRFPDQASFHRFSVTDYRAFWRLFLTWSRLTAEGDVEPVCEGDDVERGRFFP